MILDKSACLFAAALISLITCRPAASHDLSKAPERPRNVRPPETLQSIDLGKEIPGMNGRKLRMRRVTLKPGGAIPPHSHTDRPAVVYILQGQLREHRSDRDTPVEYGAGESMIESAALHHWVENIGNEPLIGLVLDIPHDGGASSFKTDQILKAYGRSKHSHK